MSCLSELEIFAWLEGGRNYVVAKHLDHCPSCSRRVEALGQIERFLSREMESSSPQRGRECPDPQDLMAFADKDEKGSAFLLESIARHLQICESCTYWTARLRYSLSSPIQESAKTPRVLRRKARELMPHNGHSRIWGRYTLAFGCVAVICLVIVIGLRYRHATMPVAELRPPSTLMPQLSEHTAPGEFHPPANSPPAVSIPRDSVSKREPAENLSAELTLPPIASPKAEMSSDTMILRGTAIDAPDKLINATFLYRPDDQGVHKHLTQEIPVPFAAQPVISADDGYIIRILLRKSGWLYVFQVNAEGHLTQLFPNSSYRTAENPLRAEQEYLLPNDQHWYRLDQVPGTETIYIIFSTAKADDWELLFRRCNEVNLQACQDLIANLKRTASEITDRQPNRTAVSFQFQHVFGAYR
jgi:hypothetical protein